MSWHHFADTKPKARKLYYCDICGENIEPGEVHVARRGVSDGRVVTSRMHLDCEMLSKRWDQMEWECHFPGDCTRQDVRDALERHNAHPDRTSDKASSVEGMVETQEKD